MERQMEIVEPPHYVRLPESDQEAFLSQLGNFNPAQRQLFHALCKNWKPEIPYLKFSEQEGRDIKNPHAELEALMRKLGQNKYGLILYRYEEGEAKKDRIVLTEREDERFSFYTLDQAVLRMLETEEWVLPSEDVIADRNITLSEGHIYTIKKEQLHKAALSESFPSPRIVSLNLSTAGNLLFPSQRLLSLIQRSMRIIREGMTNSHNLSELARYRNTSIADVKTKLETKSPAVWVDMVRSILEYGGQDSGNRDLKVPLTFYQAGELLYIYLQNEIRYAKEMREKNEERETDMHALEMQVKKLYREPVTQETFSDLIDKLEPKYGREFEEFKKEFYSRYVKVKEKTQLPPIVFLGKRYIHRDHLYRYGAFRIREISEELKRTYRSIMAAVIRKPNRQERLIFYSDKNFEDDMKVRIREEDPFMWDLLERPRIFAEAIIHTARLEKEVKEIDQVRSILEVYFIPGTMRWKPLPEVFNLNIYLIFKESYLNLSVLRQIWMRITGKFRIMEEKFVEFKPRPAFKTVDAEPPWAEGGIDTLDSSRERTAGAPVRQSGTPSAQSIGARSPGAARSAATSRKPEIYRAQRKRSKPQTYTVKRPVTKKQADEAWEEFKSSLKK
jgi:hypothetical protein